MVMVVLSVAGSVGRLALVGVRVGTEVAVGKMVETGNEVTVGNEPNGSNKFETPWIIPFDAGMSGCVTTVSCGFRAQSLIDVFTVRCSRNPPRSHKQPPRLPEPRACSTSN